ncbi:hypothetical protein TH24_21170 [Thalassospira xiamenensis]|nr:hypothetical protein TH24_21170 [Thalassospira xiamenensis]
MVAAHQMIEAGAESVGDAVALIDFVSAHISELENCQITVVAKDYAIRSWQRAGVKPIDISSVSKVDDISDVVQKLISDINPNVVLTATTDVDDRTDVMFWRKCRELNVPVAALVDHRVNINARFFDKNSSAVYPDVIFVIDEHVRLQLLDNDVAPQKVQIIGDIHLSRLKSRKVDGSSQINAMHLREKWTVSSSDMVVLFVSECLREMRMLGAGATCYDEIDSLENLLSQLRETATLGNQMLNLNNLTLVIRPHPKDAEGKYASYVSHRNINSNDLNIVVDNDSSAEIAIIASDIIVGMDSTMLGEAQALGKPVYSNCQSDSVGNVNTVQWYRK